MSETTGWVCIVAFICIYKLCRLLIKGIYKIEDDETSIHAELKAPGKETR